MPEAVIALPSLPKLIDYEDDQWPSLWRGSAAEFFATLIFVFVGTGAVVACLAQLGTSTIGVPSLTLISFAHGFAIMVLVFAVGEVSGGHINPAITWACLFTGKISVLKAVVYVFSQLFGGIVGSSLLKSLLPPEISHLGMGCHGINPALTPSQGFGAEVIFTFIFVFVVFSTAISPFAGKFSPLSGGESGKQYGPGKITPFVVGATILILHSVGIPLTGASMNPARSFGPALVNNCWKNHWVYWFGPLLGSTGAAIIAQIVFLSTPRDIFRLNKTSQKEFTDLAEVVKQEQEREKQLENERELEREKNLRRRTVPVASNATTPSTRSVPTSPKVQVPTRQPSQNAEEIPRSNTPPQEIQKQKQTDEMHKSSSGQFSAIMEEDSVVELEDYN